MPLPFLLAALFGKAAVGAAAKTIASKATAVGAKAAIGHHGHHAAAGSKLLGKLADKAVDEAAEKVVDTAADKAQAALTKKKAGKPV